MTFLASASTRPSKSCSNRRSFSQRRKSLAADERGFSGFSLEKKIFIREYIRTIRDNQRQILAKAQGFVQDLTPCFRVSVVSYSRIICSAAERSSLKFWVGALRNSFKYPRAFSFSPIR